MGETEEPISVTDEAKTEVCLFKQKTRLARIRAAKIRGTNAYMRYKQNGLLIDSLEEVTETKAAAPGTGWSGREGGRKGEGLSATLACRSATVGVFGAGAMPPHTSKGGWVS